MDKFLVGGILGFWISFFLCAEVISDGYARIVIDSGDLVVSYEGELYELRSFPAGADYEQN